MTRQRGLVTGAASGMGAATVDGLVAEGWEVVAVDRDAAGLASIAGKRESVSTIVLDLSDRDAIRRQLGDLRLDGVANIAGIGPEHDDVGQIIDVNFAAPFVVLDTLRAGLSTGASVVNVASVVGSLADDRYDSLLDDPFDESVLDELKQSLTDGAEAYTYSKRGVARESARLAVEWAPGVRVNAVSPGLVNTPLGERSKDLPWTKKMAARIPLGRQAEAEEVASLVCFLLGDRASYVNGVNIDVDGGYMAYVGLRKARRPSSAGS